MASIIGSLRAVLGLDTADFDKGIDKASKRLAELGEFKFGNGLNAGIKGVASTLEEISGKAGLAGASLAAMGGAGLAAAVGIGALTEGFAQVREALKFGDEIAAQAKKIGVSTDTLQEYRFAVHDLGGSYEDAGVALDGFSKAFGLAQAGFSKRAIKPFAALGLDPKDYADADSALSAVIKKIHDLGSVAEQNAIADKLGLSSILPAIRAGGGGIDELREKAHALGYVMSAELIEKAESANKKFEDLSAVINVQFKSAFVEAAPAILIVTQKIADLITMLAKFSESPGAKLLGGFLGGGIPGIYKAAKSAAEEQANTRKYGLLPTGDINARLKQVDEFSPHAGTSLIPVSGLGKGPSAAQIAKANDDAIAKAAKDELAARVALTADIAKLAVLRLAEVDQDTAAANRKLQDEVNEKKITQAAADRAIALNNIAAGEKKSLIRRQAEEQADAQTIAQKKEIAGYFDQVAQVEANLAATARARAAIETKSLADRQRIERIDLKNRLDHQVQSEEITQVQADLILASQADAQAAQRLSAARDQRAAIQKEDNDRAEAALRLQIDLLSSQADAAQTDGERRSIQLKILALEQLLERQKLDEVINSATSTQAEKDIAAARKGVLDEIQSNEHKAAVGSLFDAFNRAESGVSDLANAFKSHNWGRVVQDLVSTFQQIKADLAAGNKTGAIAGAGSAIGQAVGGTAGAVISGASAGATAGSLILPGIGTAIGAVIGGIVGFFSGSSAKKAQQASDAKAAAEAAAAHATAVANEKTALQIQLLEAQGDAEGALALQRQAAIASVNAENRDLETQLLDTQAAADKAAKAAAIVAQRHDLQIQLLDAEGDAVGALTARRRDELAALDDANKGFQLQIYALNDLASAKADAATAQATADQKVTDAQSALSAARDREAQAITAAVTKYQALADSLNSYLASLTTDAAAGVSLSAARGAFASTAARAQLGDAGALGSIQGVAETFRAASASQARNAVEAARDQAQIRIGIQGAAATATRQASIAEQSLDSLNKTVDGILAVNASVLTVADAIRNLQDAQTAALGAGDAALAAALARLAPAEGAANLGATPSVPTPPPIPSVPTLDSAAVVNTGSVVSNGGDTLASVIANQNLQLEAIAVATGATARTLRFFNNNGMPDVREA